MRSSILTLLKYVIGWPLSLIALLFIGKLLFGQGKIALSHITQVNIVLLVLGIFSFLIYFFLRTYFWKKMLDYEGYTLPYTYVTFLWQLSELKRFIPGNVWSLVGRAEAFATKGVPKKITAKLLSFEILYIFIGSAVASLFSLPLLLSLGIVQIQAIMITIIVFIPCALVGFTLLTRLRNIKKIDLTLKLFFSFSIKQHMIFFVLSTISFVFFGLGMYLTALSIFNTLANVGIIGIFCLAFFLGYASIVTPMGLGVREAIITWGLNPFLVLSSASLIAVFTRVVSIVSELLFTIIAVCIGNLTKKALCSIKTSIVGKRYEIILGILTLVYIIYFSLASVLRYQNYYTGRFDLGNMDQTVWNTVHGRVFQLTNPDGTNIISRLSFHADFLLILFAPFYWIWQDPRMLLLIQSVGVGIGGMFVYLLGKDLLQKRSTALLFAIIYFINPSVGFSTLYDFHAVTLATTFFLAAFYFLYKRKLFLYVIFLVLAGLTKEQVWVAIALLGIFTFFKVNKKLGASISIISSILFYYLFFVAIPKAHGGSHFALAYYSDYGSSSSQIIKTLLFSPMKTLHILTSKSRLMYLGQLFLPVGFLAFVSPLFLLFIVPELLLNMLSSTPSLHEIYYQYTAVLTPFIFLSAMLGYKKIEENLKKIGKIILIFLFVCSLYAAYLFGPLPLSKNPNIDMFTKPLPYASDIDDFIDFIPARYSIAATNNLGSHLSHRQKIFTIPLGIDSADVIVFLLNDRFAQPSLNAQSQMVQKLEKDPNYVELFKEHQFVAFAKKNLNFQRRLRKERKYFFFLQQLLPR